MVGPPPLDRVPYPYQKTSTGRVVHCVNKICRSPVHKDSIKIAVAEEGREPARFFSTVPGETGKLLNRLGKLGPKRSLRCCYEAGPGGYTVYRSLTAAGIDCKVIAPSLIPKQHGKRVKTDRLDAENLAHYLRSGDLTEVWVPDETTESLRNLVRLCEDARIARYKARQQLNQFLLRKGRVCRHLRTRWNVSHMSWINLQEFAEEADNAFAAVYLCLGAAGICNQWNQE